MRLLQYELYGGQRLRELWWPHFFKIKTKNG
jgi:hypothetical protein